MDSMPCPELSYRRPSKSPSKLESSHHGNKKVVSPQSQVGNISVDSAYFTSPESHTTGSPAEICAMRTRSSTWLSSLQSIILQKPRVSINPVSPNSDGPSAVLGFVNESSTNEQELDQFLFETWSKETVNNPRTTGSPVSQYVRKIGELKQFFELKMAEISQKEITYLSEIQCYERMAPTLKAEHPMSTDNTQLRQTLAETKVGWKFDQLRFKLKQEVVKTILQLRAEYISDPGRRKRSFRPKTTKILTEWYEQHLRHPYPTEEQKKILASQCGISTEQVTTWFNNKRYRSRSISRHRRQSPML